MNGNLKSSQPPPDPDLARVIAAWPNLTKHARRGILDIVDSLNVDRDAARPAVAHLEKLIDQIHEEEKARLDAAPRQKREAAQAKAAKKARRRNPEDFLKRILAGGRRVSAKTVYAKAKAVGIAKRTLDRAKRRLQIRTTRKGFGPGSYFEWRLPG